MSKAVFVLDMPDSCVECPLFSNHYNDMYCRAMKYRTIDYPYPKDFKQDWCPLKVLPEKDKKAFLMEWSNGYKAGWNDCIEAIL